jgi:hypothetical protein
MANSEIIGAAMNKEKEYLRRNLLHAKSVGVYFGIKAVVDRVETMRRKPQWMLEILNRELVKAYIIQKEMAAHREEMKEGRAAILGRLRNSQQQINGGKLK